MLANNVKTCFVSSLMVLNLVISSRLVLSLPNMFRFIHRYSYSCVLLVPSFHFLSIKAQTTVRLFSLSSHEMLLLVIFCVVLLIHSVARPKAFLINTDRLRVKRNLNGVLAFVATVVKRLAATRVAALQFVKNSAVAHRLLVLSHLVVVVGQFAATRFHIYALRLR